MILAVSDINKKERNADDGLSSFSIPPHGTSQLFCFAMLTIVPGRTLMNFS